jgi:hypothetical protein
VDDPSGEPKPIPGVSMLDRSDRGVATKLRAALVPVTPHAPVRERPVGLATAPALPQTEAR